MWTTLLFSDVVKELKKREHQTGKRFLEEGTTSTQGSRQMPVGETSRFLGLRFIDVRSHGGWNLGHMIRTATCFEMGSWSGGRPDRAARIQWERRMRQWLMDGLFESSPIWCSTRDQEISWYETMFVVSKKKWPPRGWFCCAIR
jgi:hypothetical protein